MGEDVEGAIQPPGVELAAVKSDDVARAKLGHQRLEHRPMNTLADQDETQLGELRSKSATTRINSSRPLREV